MSALKELAERLRGIAAGMKNGDAETDVRVAAEIIESVGNVARFEYVGAAKFRDRETKELISPRILDAVFRTAELIARKEEIC